VVPNFYFSFFMFLFNRHLAISSMWSSKRYANFSWPSRTERTRNSRGKSLYTRLYLAWTTPCRSTSGLRTSSNSSNKRYIIMYTSYIYICTHNIYIIPITLYTRIRHRVCKLCFFLRNLIIIIVFNEKNENKNESSKNWVFVMGYIIFYICIVVYSHFEKQIL